MVRMPKKIHSRKEFQSNCFFDLSSALAIQASTGLPKSSKELGNNVQYGYDFPKVDLTAFYRV